MNTFILNSKDNFNNLKTLKMKNLILTTALCFIVTLSFAQLKVVAPNGDVGVGTGTPAAKLDVLGDIKVSNVANDPSGFEIINTNATQAILKKFSLGTNSLIDINPIALDGTSNAKFRFFRQTNTTGDAKFEVHYADGTSGVNISFAGNGNSFINRDFGNVGIGTGAPTHKLSVDGTASKTGGGMWATFSDARLKKNVSEYTLGLDAILKIEPVSFQYNGKAGILDTDKTHVGVLAQDIKEVIPSTVSEVLTYEEKHVGDEFTGKSVRINEQIYLSYDPSELVYTLINAVQEQQVMIDELKTQVANLPNVVADVSIKDVSNASVFSSKQMVLSNLSSKEISKISPNPFTQVARIDYNLQREFTIATITVYDVDGQLVNQVNLETAIGTVEVEAAQLSSGMYTYTIEIDGKIVDTKRFIKE